MFALLIEARRTAKKFSKCTPWIVHICVSETGYCIFDGTCLALDKCIVHYHGGQVRY